MREKKKFHELMFLSNGGETGNFIQKFNWSQTSLGSIAQWSHSLKVALQILLASRFPMQILWGQEYIQFYNDAYIPIAAILRGSSYAVDVRVLLPNGVTRYLHSRCEPVFDARGQVVKLMESCLDITKRMQIEVVLQESKERLQLALQGGNFGTWDHDLQNIHVLVIEDDTDSRDLIVTALQQFGAKVTAVPSSVAAIYVLSHIQPDILVSDIGMPGIDGYMLMQQIREVTRTCQIPAIALTAYTSEADQQKALAVGFQKHLAKPMEPLQLLEAISTLVHTPVKIDSDYSANQHLN